MSHLHLGFFKVVCKTKSLVNHEIHLKTQHNENVFQVFCCPNASDFPLDNLLYKVNEP